MRMRTHPPPKGLPAGSNPQETCFPHDGQETAFASKGEPQFRQNFERGATGAVSGTAGGAMGGGYAGGYAGGYGSG